MVGCSREQTGEQASHYISRAGPWNIPVRRQFDRLYDELGPETFKRLFPVILTDRGTEFSNPSRIEFTKDGVRRTWVFFCNPTSSSATRSAHNAAV